MRFDFTAEEKKFRDDLARFLDDELPAGWVGPADEASDDGWALSRRIRRGLAEHGWLTMSWPAEYGGQDAAPMMNLVFAEEMSYRRAPGNDRFGTRMLGPTLMRFGSEEQKRKYLPDIANGGIQWCQGYSEPNSGSDLASLQTRAVLEGDEFVVNGTKIWTSLAHRADMIFMLVRTDPDAPRHSGISLILCDMRAPGVEVTPIINMSGSHSFNQLTFDDVRVPAENLVGELNDGWRVGVTLLNYERSGIDYVAWAQRTLDELIEFARSNLGPEGLPLAKDPDVRRRIADLDVEIEGSRLLAYEVAWRQGNGELPVAEASMSKMTASEVNLKVLDFGMDLLGMYGPLEPGTEHAELEGRILKMRLFYVSGPILAGTNEIQKNIIAQHGLGLPRK